MYWDERFSTAAVKYGMDTAEIGILGPDRKNKNKPARKHGYFSGRQQKKKTRGSGKSRGGGGTNTLDDARAAAFILQSYLDYAQVHGP